MSEEVMQCFCKTVTPPDGTRMMMMAVFTSTLCVLYNVQQLYVQYHQYTYILQYQYTSYTAIQCAITLCAIPNLCTYSLFTHSFVDFL